MHTSGRYTGAPIPGLGGAAHHYPCCCNLSLRLLQCILHGDGLEEHLEISTGAKCGCKLVKSARCKTRVTPPLHELHWLPVYFWIKFKVLVVSFKSLNGLELGYLRDCLLTRLERPQPYCPFTRL